MSATEAKIAAWQKAVGIEPAKGGRADILDALSKAAFEAIKVIERDRSGIRDGDGYWHGGDVIGHMTSELVELCRRLTEASLAEVKPRVKETRTPDIGRLLEDLKQAYEQTFADRTHWPNDIPTYPDWVTALIEQVYDLRPSDGPIPHRDDGDLDSLPF